MQARQQLGIKTGPDFAAEYQLSVFIKSHEQRAEIFSAAFGIGVTPDHKLLLAVQLQLNPCPAAFAGFVGRVLALADKTFQAEFFGFLQ
jgi:hypothetical protein